MGERSERTLCLMQEAHDRYWNAHTPHEERAAQYQIMLLGGRDGYAVVGILRQRLARALRWLAAEIDRFGE